MISSGRICIPDTNVFYAKYLPMSAPLVFDNTGSVYDSGSVIINGTFSVDAYKAYSPLYMPITFALAYGVTFASYTSVFVHTWRTSISSMCKTLAND